MSSISVDFSDEQIQAIDNLRKALHELKAQDVHVSGLNDYEVHIWKDSVGEPYISLT